MFIAEFVENAEKSRACERLGVRLENGKQTGADQHIDENRQYPQAKQTPPATCARRGRRHQHGNREKDETKMRNKAKEGEDGYIS